MAERVGFEPTIQGYRIHTFQACAFDHSATAPRAIDGEGAALAGAACHGKRGGPHIGTMTKTSELPPTLGDIEALARAALERLPEDFRRHLEEIVLQVEDFASDEVLADLGIENPFELSGLYEGIALTQRSIEHSGTMPDRIFLYRRPLLDEWAERGDVTLEDLVTHVLVHEAGHHFGLSDEGMHALEDAAR